MLRDATPDEMATWDAITVDSPGGHVLQSRAWAAHRATTGWRPRFLASDEGVRILALERRWAMVPGGSAYIPRGPVAGGTGSLGTTGSFGAQGSLRTPGSMDASGPAESPGTGARVPPPLATALIAAATCLAASGSDVVAADPEVAAADTEFTDAIGRAGFRAIEEIQPSRHRIALPITRGEDESAAFRSISKSTRQRIRAAEPAVRVVRYDCGIIGETGDGFEPSPAPGPGDDPFGRFADLLAATGERRGFRFGRSDFVAWWRAGHAAGHIVLLEARDADELIAGLLLYRHGGRVSTAHSADRADLRRRHPGALHLLRWRALQLAIREGCTELDLGGVDVSGARRPPREGEPMFGLYQHKLSFGGQWMELVGAHERVFRPARYALGRMSTSLGRRLGRGVSPDGGSPS